MFCVTTDQTRLPARGIAVAVLGLALAGCGAGGGLSGSSSAGSSSGSFTDRMSAALFGPPAGSGDPAAAGTSTPAEPDCPGVDIRAGGATLAVNQPGAEATPMTLRYQASLGRTARECASLGATMTIKVGVEGRIVVGPAGAPGQTELPLRYSLVKEGAQPRTILTKFHRVPVSIAPGQGNIGFVHVEEDLTFPVPPGEELLSYVVYVGFDPEGLKERPVAKRRAPRK